MKYILSKQTLLYNMFFLLFVTTCFQKLIIFNFGSFSFKASHFVSLLFLPFLLKEKIIKMPGKNISLFFYFMLVVSILNLFIYGFDSLLLNYIFSFYYLILILTIGKSISKKQWIEIIQKTALIVLSTILIKNLIYINTFVNFFKSPYGHPSIYTFFGGGVNMEATWIAMLGFFFYKNKKGIPYSIVSLIISALYTSRVGIIASLIVLIANFLSTNDFKKKKLVLKGSNLILAIFGIIALIITFRYGIFDYVIKRFFITGQDSGSLGRLSMWEYVYKAFANNPLGYGVGNAMKGIELVSNVDFIETNVHNIFFQMLLDLGIIGLIWYSIIVISFSINRYKNFFNDSFVAFILTYFLLSLIQFRGGDAILYYIIGIYMLEHNKLK